MFGAQPIVNITSGLVPTFLEQRIGALSDDLSRCPFPDRGAGLLR